MAKILSLNTDGSLQEVQPVSTSAGAGDSGKVAQLDANGKWDVTMMPTGIGADTQAILTSEVLVAGDFVNIYDNAGTKTCRKANAADNTKPACGFVLAGFGSAVTATVYVRGLNTAVPVGAFVAANVGKKAFLSATTAGAATLTIPATAGQIAQVVGTIDAVGATVTVNFTESAFTVRA
jgi:hypothetical protein